MSKSPKFNVGKEKLSAQCEPCELPVSPASLKIRACVFFDGTGNNKFNTNAGLRARMEGRPVESGSSYDNDLSNIARLSNAFQFYSKKYDIQLGLYIVGVGTGGNAQDATVWGAGATNEKRGDGENRKNDEGTQADSKYEMGLGTGSTGVVTRVDLAHSTLRSEIERRIKIFRKKKKLPTKAPVIIEKVELDAFGFSRGAAQARRFVYVVLNTEEYVQVGRTIVKMPAGLAHGLSKIPQVQSVGPIQFVFLGLYDCVSSYGLDHNDVVELKLNWLNRVERVVHLCAADEHRKNFALTNISSAGSKGVEIFLPGVHSDVGGGYVDYRGDTGLWVFKLDVIEKSQFKRAGRRLIRFGGRVLDQTFVCEGGSHRWTEQNTYPNNVSPKSSSVCPKGYRAPSVNTSIVRTWPDEYEEWPDEWRDDPDWISENKEKYEVEQKWLEQSGWFRNSLTRMESTEYGWFQDLPRIRLRGFSSSRATIRNRYSFVTLQLMSDYAMDSRWSIKFNRSDIYGVHSLSRFPFLRSVQLQLQAYIAQKCGPVPTSNGIGTSRWSDWFSYPEPCDKASQYPWLAQLRFEYCNFSSHYSDGFFMGTIIGPFDPNFINGRRERRVIVG